MSIIIIIIITIYLCRTSSIKKHGDISLFKDIDSTPQSKKVKLLHPVVFSYFCRILLKLFRHIEGSLWPSEFPRNRFE